MSEERKRYIVMHESEAGFDSVMDAESWIHAQEDPDKYRVAAITEDLDFDKTAEIIYNAERKMELERAYAAGKDYEKDRIKTLLGLS